MKTTETYHSGHKKIRVLIVHSLVGGRAVLKQALSDCSDIDVTGTAPSGSIGLMKVRDMQPDIVLLDVGITDTPPSVFTTSILKAVPEAGIILITPYSPEQKIISETVTSLQNGAFDFIKRPGNVPEKQESTILHRRLLPKIRTFSIRRYSRYAKITSGKSGDTGHTNLYYQNDYSSLFPEVKEGVFKIVVIGVSTGGPEALSRIIPELPASFPLPIVIILHMPKLFTQSMANELNKKSSLTVKEAGEGDPLKKGTVYLAKGGHHLVLQKKNPDQFILHLDDSPEVNGCKPSVDVFFFSVADVMNKKVIGVILSGMGEDGVKGISRLKKKGARTIAQDAETSIVWGMPGGAVQAGVIDEVLPIHAIPGRLAELTGCL